MKRIVCAVVMLLTSAAAWGAPWVITDPVAVGVTHCGRYEAGVFKIDVPIVAGACKFDIGTQPVSTVSYTATAVINDQVWGRQESVQSLPLSVVRPAAPQPPVGLHAIP